MTAGRVFSGTALAFVFVNSLAHIAVMVRRGAAGGSSSGGQENHESLAFAAAGDCAAAFAVAWLVRGSTPGEGTQPIDSHRAE